MSCCSGCPTRCEADHSGAAGAGSLVLEFAVLSRLTGDPRFEVRDVSPLTRSSWRVLADFMQQAAHNAYMAIWNKRSEHDLIGNGIGVSHGQWLQPGFSGIGAGIDSFYEYGMKAAILLGKLPGLFSESHELTSQVMMNIWMCFRIRTLRCKVISGPKTASS